ncbi:MAG: hypothetical protein A3F54_04055 [Candidatus Kerfeldbacteria bacterium RIFCSPHIGHO2_12_FULL_48_17]|uniref:Uncharacterized protein n=1 Tax=Candidatus Kerfeldbacteria bacterium RIFCSPHIGHO2_12_FULL_48_17 TaxID=1798542 RepID=A0A1G2B1Q4_9BACT|nr:MAG: hypothetical protein A3F54_04055 [Candidatus Kerfeldbacteria bacterium RIFCSPHIGHO2_12_FULL_48_17]
MSGFKTDDREEMKMNTKKATIDEAYAAWVNARPLTVRIPAGPESFYVDGVKITREYPVHHNGNCCSEKHVYTLLPDGKPHPLRGQNKPDALVCDRERAWRNYVRIRDGVN